MSDNNCPTMGCPHFRVDDTVHPATCATAIRALSKNKRTQCHAGRCSKGRAGLWMCLTCATLHCGRFIQGHALDHHDQSGHPVAMDLETYCCHCYKCDAYVDERIVGEHLNPLRAFLNSRKAKKVTIPSAPPSAPSTPPPTNPGAAVDATPAAGSPGRLPGGGSGRKGQTLPKSKMPTSSRKCVHVTGLGNLGNTCFANVVLQTLCHTLPLQHFYLDTGKCRPMSPPRPVEVPPEGGDAAPSGPVTRQAHQRKDTFSICNEFCQLLRNMWLTPAPALTPEAFLHSVWRVVPAFRGYHQQDAQEFIRFLLDKMNTELLARSPRTVIARTFQGSLYNQVTCLQCGHVSTKKDMFLDLSLPIPERFSREKNKVYQRMNPCTLHDCLEAFTETEELADTELYHCQRCNHKTHCTKKLQIDRLPQVLSLHLKRFRYTRSNRSKIDTYVEFPITDMDMRPFLKGVGSTGTGTSAKGPPPGSSSTNIGGTIYDLFSVIVHQGSCGSGHYFAYVWSPQNDSWMKMNDSVARSSTAEALIAEQAYMLFYLKRGSTLPLRADGTLVGESSSSALSSSPIASPAPTLMLSRTGEEDGCEAKGGGGTRALFEDAETLVTTMQFSPASAGPSVAWACRSPSRSAPPTPRLSPASPGPAASSTLSSPPQAARRRSAPSSRKGTPSRSPPAGKIKDEAGNRSDVDDEEVLLIVDVEADEEEVRLPASAVKRRRV